MAAVEVHHEVSGPPDGPALVLANSLGSTLSIWDAYLPGLANRRVVRYDLRGHGGSPAPPGPYAMADLGADVLALLDRLGIGRTDFCGVSLGGMVGLWLAAHAPQRIGRLMVICTTARMDSPEPWAERAATVRADGPGAIAETVVSRWFTPPFAAREPELVARMVAMIGASDPEGYAGCCDAIQHMDQRADLPRIEAPTLVVAGRDDQAIPPEHGAAIAAAVPGARLELLDGAAHLPVVERADAIEPLLREHLEATDDR